MFTHSFLRNVSFCILGKGKKKTGPSSEELHSVVTSILKEVDFNTVSSLLPYFFFIVILFSKFNLYILNKMFTMQATLADILKQLGKSS